MDKIQIFDNNIIEFVKDIQTSFLNDLFLNVTKIGNTKTVIVITFILAVIAFIYFFVLSKKAQTEDVSSKLFKLGILNAIYPVATIGIIAAINKVIKHIVQRPRPNVFPELITETGYSFPSGHAMASAGLAIVLIYFIVNSNMDKIWKYVFSFLAFFVTLAVALSRVYLGVHYLSDVLCGLALGYILGIVISIIFEKISDKIKED